MLRLVGEGREEGGGGRGGGRGGGGGGEGRGGRGRGGEGERGEEGTNFYDTRLRMGTGQFMHIIHVHVYSRRQKNFSKFVPF